MGLLTREMMTTLPDLGTEDVELTTFGGTIRLRDWDGTARDDFDFLLDRRGDREEWDSVADGKLTKKRDGRGLRAAAIAVSAVDENGNRVFNMNGDVDTISKWPHSDLFKASEVVFRRNKLGSDQVEDAKKN